jgi:hypothetical protein
MVTACTQWAWSPLCDWMWSLVSSKLGVLYWSFWQSSFQIIAWACHGLSQNSQTTVSMCFFFCLFSQSSCSVLWWDWGLSSYTSLHHKEKWQAKGLKCWTPPFGDNVLGCYLPIHVPFLITFSSESNSRWLPNRTSVTIDLVFIFLWTLSARDWPGLDFLHCPEFQITKWYFLIWLIQGKTFGRPSIAQQPGIYVLMTARWHFCG